MIRKSKYRNKPMALLCLEHRYMKYHNQNPQFEELVYFDISEEKVLVSIHKQPPDKIRQNPRNDPRYSGFIGNKEWSFNSFQTRYLIKERWLKTLTFITEEEFKEAFNKHKLIMPAIKWEK